MSLGPDEPTPLEDPVPLLPLPPFPPAERPVWVVDPPSVVEPGKLVMPPLPLPLSGVVVDVGSKVVPLSLLSLLVLPPPSWQIEVLVSQVNPSLQHPVPHLTSVAEHVASHFWSGKHLTPAGQQESVPTQGE